MRIKVNGISLYFDVEGASLVPDGPKMREKPTLLLLHGGPGADHTVYKPLFGGLSDVAQVVYLDLRGNGRSDDGDPADWTLAQWGDDVRAFCDALGIERPFVYGASFGGIVAQAYATRHVGHAGGVVLAATTARHDFEKTYRAFGRIGDAKAEAVARAYWSAPSPERRQAYFETCLPLYAVGQPDPDMMARMTIKNPVAMAFNGPENEQGRFDFRSDLARLTCPVLIISGDQDVIMPAAFSEQIEAALTCDYRHVKLPDCGHLQSTDQPERLLAVVRDFLNENTVSD